MVDDDGAIVIALGTASAAAQAWNRATATPWSGSPERLEDFHPLGHPLSHSCNTPESSGRVTVSVVIPAWNCESSLDVVLRAIALSLYARHFPDRVEVVVCDDGSTDGTWSVLESCALPVRLVTLRQSHTSQSAAVNAALGVAGGDVIVFVDADIVLGCGAIDAMVSRIERWPQAICIGFRSNIDPSAAVTEPLWELMHREALSGDNRVRFDLPSLVPNMMTDTSWLADLDNGCAMLDSQGSLWPRHRFVYGCLFAARRELVLAAGGFPDDMKGWGYNDTLCAANMEARGGFVLPVTSAWAHHIKHPLRHPEQWMQMRRNEMAYRQKLAEPPAVHLVRGQGPKSSEVLERKPAAPPESRRPSPVRASWATWHSLGDFEATGHAEAPPDAAAYARFVRGNYEECADVSTTRTTVWGALSLTALGYPKAANEVLQRCNGETAQYAASGSWAEFAWLTQHYETVGLERVAHRYRLMCALIRGADE